MCLPDWKLDSVLGVILPHVGVGDPKCVQLTLTSFLFIPSHLESN